MEALMNRVRFEAERVQNLKAPTRLGTVSSYDPANYAVKVILQPDGTETGFIPMTAILVGNGWGIQCGPAIGSQVMVEFQEDGHEVPIAAGFIFDNKNRPLNVPSGEMWIVHQTGASIKLLTNGNVQINSTAEIDVGNVGGSLHTLLTDAFLNIFNNHIHTNGNAGADTGTVVTPLTSAAFTSVLKAN